MEPGCDFVVRRDSPVVQGTVEAAKEDFELGDKVLKLFCSVSQLSGLSLWEHRPLY